MAVDKKLLRLTRAISDLIRPTPILTIPEWAKQYLRLPTSSSSEGGPLDIQARTPYLVQPLADFINPDIRRIVLMTATQVGKTATILSAMLYQAFNNPSPMMLVLPSKTFVKEFNKKRIRPLIHYSPAIAPLFADDKGKSTLITLFFRGGQITLAGSGVATDLSSESIRDLFLDEVDRYELDAGGEGNPISIVRSRLATYSYNSTELMTSTPVKDTDNIYTNYLLGDQQKYHVPCPSCGVFQELLFEQLRWNTIDDVYYECQHNSCKIEHRQHSAMLQAGKWVAEAISSSTSIVSYNLSVMYSPFYPWKNTVQDYLEVKGDASKERTFRNSRLGLPYSEQQIVHSHKLLYARREEYNIGDPLNDRAVVLVCAFDIQETWVEGIVYAVCAGFELYCVDTIDIRGRFEEQELQNQLAKAIDKTYTTTDGRVLSISCTAIDISYNTQSVYDWIKKVQRYDDGKVKAIRGSSIKKAAKTIVYPKIKSEKQVYTIDTDLFKENFYSRLKIERQDEDTPGYIHYGQLHESAFVQLTSESKMMKINNHTRRPEYRWCITARDGRNELLDATVYCLALIHILYRKWDASDFEEQKMIDLRHLKMSESSGRKVGDNLRHPRDPRRVSQPSHSDNFGTDNVF